MADHRPFSSREEIHHFAADVWWRLGEADWTEAFAAHPQIGDTSGHSTSSDPQNWSKDEQAGSSRADKGTLQKLASANETYRRRFGFIFIICATGKSSEEMLDALESRLGNDPIDELPVAAREQMEITHLRIEKLLDELEHGTERS